MKKLGTLLILLIVFLVASFIIIEQKNNSKVTVLWPNGGETIEAGSTQIINWGTKNIPEGNKISISIRRVLATGEVVEGQEFDPLLFVNLENTGTIEWEVSESYPEGDYILEINSYESLPMTNPISDESDTAFKITKSNSSAVADDSWSTYKNENFSYQIKYPTSLTLKEFLKTGTGGSFIINDEDPIDCLTVSARTAVGPKAELAFDDYVKEAAIQEIQGVTELNSIETITTNTGDSVYKTTWSYKKPGDDQDKNLAITYLEGPGSVGAENYKTIQLILNDSRCEDVYNQMLLTFGK
ncbi:MAG: hypothetical protein JST_000668 [Candidatus Parcubacteria bacterium]|nr:MAG: hypothetical protein JST_6190 [Candidatus Parcubacteria bacterium]